MMVDNEGNVWYSDFGEMFIGKFDPKTLKLTECPMKKFKANAPVGNCSASNSTKTASCGSTPCTRARSAASIPKTGEITYYPLAPEFNDDRVQLNFIGLRHEVDGKVWTKSVGTQDIFRLDLATNKWERFQPTNELPGVKHVRHLSGDLELQEQSVDGRVHRRPSRQDRRQDRRR